MTEQLLCSIDKKLKNQEIKEDINQIQMTKEDFNQVQITKEDINQIQITKDNYCDKIENSIIEKYLEKYSVLLIKRIEEKFTK
jgi:hypothetical protein